MKGPSKKRSLAGHFPCLRRLLGHLLCLWAQRGTVSGSRSCSLSEEGRAPAPGQDLHKAVCSPAGPATEAAGDEDEAWRYITGCGWMSGQWVGGGEA